MKKGISAVETQGLAFTYADTGCNLHPSCLRCPRERCQYDDPSQHPLVVLAKARQAEIRNAYARTGDPIGTIAAHFNISTRTVHRAITGMVRQQVEPPPPAALPLPLWRGRVPTVPLLEQWAIGTEGWGVDIGFSEGRNINE